MPFALMCTRQSGRTRRLRRGFTLAELMISLVLFGVVVASVMQVVVRQQRFHRGANETMAMRGSLHQAAAVLPADLRAIHPAGGDIQDWSRSSIAFRAFTASSMVCRRPTSTTIVLPPTALTQENALSAWLQAPVVGDSVLIYDENVGIGNEDDRWLPYEITGVSTAQAVTGCPSASGYTLAGDAAAETHELTLSAPLPATVLVGAPTRVYRTTRFALYQAADDRWYLGTSPCHPSQTPVCSDLQPVSGPYRPLSLNTAISGLTFWYFDAAGTSLDPATDAPAQVARIEVVVRGEIQTPFNTTRATGTYRDSLSFIIGIRNRE